MRSVNIKWHQQAALKQFIAQMSIKKAEDVMDVKRDKLGLCAGPADRKRAVVAGEALEALAFIYDQLKLL